MSVMDSTRESGHSTPDMPCIIEPKQYKEMIKTIRAGTHESFDKKVNELLSEGWTVKNAYIFMNGNGNGSTLYCAILSRYYETDIENGEGNQVQKHARWIISFNGACPYCSNCKVEPQGRVTTPFCPNCGAKMDGDNDGKD